MTNDPTLIIRKAVTEDAAPWLSEFSNILNNNLASIPSESVQLVKSFFHDAHEELLIDFFGRLQSS